MTAEAYLNDYKASHDRASTIRHATESVGRLEAWLNGQPITAAKLGDFRAHLASVTSSNNFRNMMLSHVRCYVRWLALRGVIQLTDLEIKAALKAYPLNARLLDVLGQDEIKRLVVAAGAYRGTKPVGALVLAGLLTGARRGELTSLALSDIDLGNRKILLSSTKTRIQREFPLVLCGVGAGLFDRLVHTHRRLCYDFRAWKDVLTAAEVKTQYKSLRATFSSYAKSAEMNPWLVDKLLAHSAAVAEKHYDRAIFGVRGQSAPEWYGCEAEMREAVEQVQLT